MPEEPYAIEAVGLSKRYGEFLAVDRVNFTVQVGEIFGFLGPNGAGKTTTVRMLITLLAPSEGTAFIHGHDILSDSYGVREQIGVVPETSNVYVELSAWDNLIFSAELYGVPRRARESRARELLETLGLWEKRLTKAKAFSKGMKRRLTIAMALAPNPPVIFLDEPTSGLDVQSSILIRNLIRKLNSDGATIFLSTHQMDEANQMCDRVAIINHGKIACVDAPENLKQTMQSVQSLVVSFTETPQALTQELATLDGVLEVRKDGDKFKLFARNPGAVVSHLVDLSRRHEVELISLNTLGPSLEDVFLKVTGIDICVTEKGEKHEVA